MKYVKNHESQLLNVAAGNGVAIACGDVPQVKNSMLFHFMELSKEEHVLHMIYAWKKENYNPALALFLNGCQKKTKVNIVEAYRWCEKKLLERIVILR